MFSMTHPMRAVALALAGVMLMAPASAEPPPFPDFTFKRVTPPKPGEKRITVQIAPSEPEVAPQPQEDGPAAKARADTGAEVRYAWFWNSLEAETETPAPRLELALKTLGNPPSGAHAPAPALAGMLDIAGRHGSAMMRHTVGTGVSPALALAVVAVESGGRVDAVSSKGARGLMQLMPDTARRFGVEDVTDAADNLRGGVGYLDQLLAEFAGDPILALAAYNAGEGAVRRHGGVPPFAETRAYVPQVLAAFGVARALCKTPPELISDGCVFELDN
ncbi:lytic transglycosylase domain-containing protein [Sediminimonas sp.]|uniref:lytic transglycosylase domain-containing protein n=1 Tax=Sediminimonas sp. TaxID=2823379 RepID=UPI0028707F84|nr:lytic transglycosylase domain-containing protein [Sediminimonas sp.]